MANKHLNDHQITKVSPLIIEKMVRQALMEDIGPEDINARLVHQNTTGWAQVITRDDMVLCGSDWVNEVFKQMDPNITINWFFSDGDTITKNQVIFEIKGAAQSILSGERTALNFLQMLSAVATKTQHNSLSKNGLILMA